MGPSKYAGEENWVRLKNIYQCKDDFARKWLRAELYGALLKFESVSSQLVNFNFVLLHHFNPPPPHPYDIIMGVDEIASNYLKGEMGELWNLMKDQMRGVVIFLSPVRDNIYWLCITIYSLIRIYIDRFCRLFVVAFTEWGVPLL